MPKWKLLRTRATTVPSPSHTPRGSLTVSLPTREHHQCTALLCHDGGFAGVLHPTTESAKATRNLARGYQCRGGRALAAEPAPHSAAPRRFGPPRKCRAPPREGAGALRSRSGTFRDHGAALQPAPVRVAASSALQARTGALLLRPRRAVRGQHGGQLQGGGVRRARTGPLRGPGFLRHAGSGAAHGAQLGRSVLAIAGSVSARLGRPGRARVPGATLRLCRAGCGGAAGGGR